MYDGYLNVNIAFFEEDGYVIKLVVSAAPDSVVAELYKKFRNAHFHLCYVS